MELLEKDYYDLTCYLRKTAKTLKEYNKYLPLLEDISLFLIGTVDMVEEKIFNPLNYQESLEIVEQFLAYYSPEFLANYLNIKSLAEKIKFVSVEGINEKIQQDIKVLKEKHEMGVLNDDKFNKALKYHNSRLIDDGPSGVYPNGKTVIYLKGNIEDVFVIAHEFMHAIFFQNIGYAKRPFNYEFLVEINSLTIELLLAQYLNDMGIYGKDAKKYIANRFVSTKENAYQVAFEVMLLKIVQEQNMLDEKTIDEYIRNSEEILREDMLSSKKIYLDNIWRKGQSIMEANRYILALFLASYLKQEIVETHDLSKLLTIGTAIYQQDLGQALERVGLNFFDVSVTKNLFGKIKREDIYFNEDIDIFKWAFLKEYQNIQTRSR